MRLASLAVSLLLLLILVGDVAQAQVAIYKGKQYTPTSFSRATWCSCPMCQNIRAQWASSQRVVEPQATQVATSYRTEYRTRTKQVKRCVRGRCYWETVTEMVPVQVPIVTSLPSKPPLASRVTSTAEPNMPDQVTNTELVPTPSVVVEEMLRLLAPAEHELLMDLGSGDGRILMAAADKFGCKTVGVELNKESAERSREVATLLGLSSRVLVFTGDARDYDLSGANCITMYLYEPLMAELVPKMAAGTRVASYMHPIPGIDARKHLLGEHVIFVGVK